MSENFPDKATVLIGQGLSTISLTFDDPDAALELDEWVGEHLKEYPPSEALTVVLTGGPFSRHTRRFPSS